MESRGNVDYDAISKDGGVNAFGSTLHWYVAILLLTVYLGVHILLKMHGHQHTKRTTCPMVLLLTIFIFLDCIGIKLACIL